MGRPDNHKVLFFIPFVLVIIATFTQWQTIWNYSAEIGLFFRKVSRPFLIVLFIESFLKYPANKRVLIIISTLLVCLISWNSGTTHGFLFRSIFVLIIGSKDIPFKVIVRTHLILISLLCFINLLFDYLGWTNKSLIYLADEREGMFGDNIIKRFSGGYPAATDFATHIMYMFIDLWILKDGKFSKWNYVFIIITMCIVVFKCDARQTAICMALIVLCSCYLHIIIRRNNHVGIFFRCFLYLCIPLFFFISVLSTLMYNESDLRWIVADYILSHRLRLGYDGIQEFGISVFGQDIKLVGGGFAGGVLEYNYIDNAYVQFLLRWGIVGMSLLILIFVVVCIKASRRGDYSLLFSVFVVGVSSLTTQFMFYPHYCILLLAVFSSHNKLLTVPSKV